MAPAVLRFSTAKMGQRKHNLLGGTGAHQMALDAEGVCVTGHAKAVLLPDEHRRSGHALQDALPPHLHATQEVDMTRNPSHLPHATASVLFRHRVCKGILHSHAVRDHASFRSTTGLGAHRVGAGPPRAVLPARFSCAGELTSFSSVSSSTCPSILFGFHDFSSFLFAATAAETRRTPRRRSRGPVHTWPTSKCQT